MTCWCYLFCSDTLPIKWSCNVNLTKFKSVDMFPNKQKSRFQVRFSSILKSRLSPKPIIARLLQPILTSFLSAVLHSQHAWRWGHSCQEILAQMFLSKIPSVETYPQREFVCENISVKVWFYYIAPLIQLLGKNASQTLSPI